MCDGLLYELWCGSSSDNVEALMRPFECEDSVDLVRGEVRGGKMNIL